MMSQDDCIFCRIVDGQIPSAKIYEDDAVLAFLDIGPLSPGHSLVIPKQHYSRITACPAEVLGEVGQRLGKVAAAVVEATGAEGCNVLCNNGRVAGQLVEHVHFHVIPRMSGDGLFGRWPAGTYKEGQLEELAAKISDSL